MENVWIQLIVTSGAILSAMFVTVRYAINQANKKEKQFLDFMQKMQTQQLEYYEQKNGHLERISKSFSAAINKNTRSLDRFVNSKTKR